MFSIGKEATDFVCACEAIHALLARGDALAPEDRDLVEYSGSDLLSQVRLT
jgi:hypothetical protein